LTRQHTPLPPAKDLGCPLDLGTAVYFGARDEVVRGKPVDLFNLPPPNFLEIGRQIEI
jgi:hypothetical protein